MRPGTGHQASNFTKLCVANASGGPRVHEAKSNTNEVTFVSRRKCCIVNSANRRNLSVESAYWRPTALAKVDNLGVELRCSAVKGNHLVSKT